MKRTQLKRKTSLRKVSAKRKAHHQSDEGKEELLYMGRVKSLPCVICGAPPPSDAHHSICDRLSARKTSAFQTIPLCKKHHDQGEDAIHNGKKSWIEKYGEDWRYIPSVLEALGECDG